MGAACADTRIALVIGNSHYVNTPALANPGNDATDVATALSSLGFKVTLRLDASKRQFDQSLAQFSRDAKAADAALFYYAGHGMQFQGRNFLMPADAELRDEISLRYEMTTVDEVKETLRASKGVKILVLDACRDNPLANQLMRSIQVSTRDVPRVQGFARDERANGMVVVYSTQADEVAHDGGGRNSPFTEAFLKELKEPGLEVGALFRRVESDVFAATDGVQSPELSISMVPDYHLNQSETDQTVWARVRANADAATLHAFLARYPNSFYAPDAAARLDLIESQARKQAEAEKAAAAARSAADEAARLKARQSELDKVAQSAKDREQELANRLATAEAEKARLGDALAKSAQDRAKSEEQARQRASQEEQDRAQREAALRSEFEKLQASDAEKQRLLQKSLDDERARAVFDQAAEKHAQDAEDAKARAGDEQAQALKRRIAELEITVGDANAEADRQAKLAADARDAAKAAAASSAADEAARLQVRQNELDKAAQSAKDLEQKLADRLAAAEAEKTRLGDELAKAADDRAAAEEQARQRASQEEQDRAQREAALRSEIERLQASDAEKQSLLQKALDEDRAHATAEQAAAHAADEAAKDAEDVKAREGDEQAQALRRRVAELEAQAADARAEAEREAQQAADARKAAEKSQQQVAVANTLASTPTVAPPQPTAAMLPQLRDELRRLGCYAGGDLDWDAPAMKLGVAKYVRYASLANATPGPDQSLLDDMKKRRAGLCPPECSPSEVAVGGQCVAKTCPAGEALSRLGVCARPEAASTPRAVAVRAPRRAPAAPAPARASGGGHCFNFNGNQYCE